MPSPSRSLRWEAGHTSGVDHVGSVLSAVVGLREKRCQQAALPAASNQAHPALLRPPTNHVGGTPPQGMRVRPDGPQLISELIRKELGLDCSVLMGANIAADIARGELSEATIAYSVLDHALLLQVGPLWAGGWMHGCCYQDVCVLRCGGMACGGVGWEGLGAVEAVCGLRLSPRPAACPDACLPLHPVHLGVPAATRRTCLSAPPSSSPWCQTWWGRRCAAL